MIRRSNFNLGLQRPQLGAKSRNTYSTTSGSRLSPQSVTEQLFNPIASDRCNHAKLGKVSSDRVDHRRLLADEQMARAMEHQSALLLGCLGWHNEPVFGWGARGW